MRIPWILAGLAMAGAACGGGKSSFDANDAADADAADAVDAPDVPDVPDVAPDAADGEAEADAPPADPCVTLGLPHRDFTAAENSSALYATAADITVNTWDGPWTLSTAWTGCDSYLFIQDVPQQDDGVTPALWTRDVNTLFSRLPRNVQLFFVATSPSPVPRDRALNALKVLVDAALAAMTDADRAWWTARVHYLPDQAAREPGWLGTLMASPNWGVGIDRFQRLRFIGSYGDPNRYDAGIGWFDDNLSMAANEARYYNFEATRQAALDAEDATVVHLLSGEVVSDPGWAGVRTSVDVTLPDATTMAGFDTLELDLYLGCVGDGEMGDCPAWDYINSLYLCDADHPDSCDVEFGRWITTYHREGRWVHDVSDLLPLLAGGGSRRFQFYSQQPYEVTLDLRFSNAHKAVRPQEIYPLFTGGALATLSAPGTYPAPITLAIPADAAKVEIATVLTGHGGEGPANCAEFCSPNHHFIVNGHDNVINHPEAGTGLQCMDAVEQGTVPNQFGTWWYGRDGWCPGKEVDLVPIDVTAQVTLGADNVFDYHADFAGSPYTAGGGANIDLVSWVVVSR